MQKQLQVNGSPDKNELNLRKNNAKERSPAEGKQEKSGIGLLGVEQIHGKHRTGEHTDELTTQRGRKTNLYTNKG